MLQIVRKDAGDKKQGEYSIYHIFKIILDEVNFNYRQ